MNTAKPKVKTLSVNKNFNLFTINYLVLNCECTPNNVDNLWSPSLPWTKKFFLFQCVQRPMHVPHNMFRSHANVLELVQSKQTKVQMFFVYRKMQDIKRTEIPTKKTIQIISSYGIFAISFSPIPVFHILCWVPFCRLLPLLLFPQKMLYFIIHTFEIE